ncbi:MAG: glycosyltransferase [Candidatus Sericytochromatia bacterium]|nr:glycosyltransferase [Candidatus Sericytochromatia bacterium]
MKVALVHEWLTNLAGSERVVEALACMFPGAPVHVAMHRGNLGSRLGLTDVRTSFLQRLPLPHQATLPLMPLAFEQFDLRAYDLVLTSTHACAKGVLVRPDALHVAYCHTPTRYLWDMAPEYLESLPAVMRPFAAWQLHRLRQWDVLAARRVDHWIANSGEVRSRIRRWYGADAAVVPPPVDVSRFRPAPADEIGRHMLVVSRLVPYKRVDLAVAACSQLGVPLRVIGDGPERRRLEAMAGPGVTFLGALDDERVAHELARADALLFPGLEDFGIVPVEAMASGRPVIALGLGGALDSVRPGVTGCFFPEAEVPALVAAIGEARRIAWQPQAMVAHAAGFAPDRFKQRIAAVLDSLLAAHREQGVPTQAEAARGVAALAGGA